MRRFQMSVAALFFLVVGLASTTLAQTRVEVSLRNAQGQPADGRVTLTAKEGGATFSCQATGGSCQITQVPGGLYVVTVAPSSGASPPPPRTVMVPPSGSTRLVVSTGHG